MSIKTVVILVTVINVSRQSPNRTKSLKLATESPTELNTAHVISPRLLPRIPPTPETPNPQFQKPLNKSSPC